MHLINSFLFQDTPSGDDVLFTALVDKATILGYTLPSANTLSALNTLIKDMRRIGMIQRLDLFHVYASDLGAETDFRLMNIVNPEMIGEQNGILNWDNRGSKGTGSTSRGCINTKLNPYAGGYNYIQNNASMGVVVFEDNSTNDINSVLIGSSSLVDRTISWNILRSYATRAHRINDITTGGGGQFPTAINLAGSGLKIINRTNELVSIYDQYFIHESSRASASIQNEDIYIHNAYNYTTASTYFGVNGISCAFAGAAIPYNMAQNFRQVYNKYLRTIGLQQVA